MRAERAGGVKNPDNVRYTPGTSCASWRTCGRSELSAWVSVYTTASEDPTLAARVLEGFDADMSASIGLALASPASVQHQAAAGEPDRS